MIVMLSLNSIFPAVPVPPRLVLTVKSALSPRTKLVAAPPSVKTILSALVENVGSVPPRAYASAIKV